MALKRAQETAIRIDMRFARRFTRVDETENRSAPLLEIGCRFRFEDASYNIMGALRNIMIQDLSAIGRETAFLREVHDVVLSRHRALYFWSSAAANTGGVPRILPLLAIDIV